MSIFILIFSLFNVLHNFGGTSSKPKDQESAANDLSDTINGNYICDHNACDHIILYDSNPVPDDKKDKNNLIQAKETVKKIFYSCKDYTTIPDNYFKETFESYVKGIAAKMGGLFTLTDDEKKDIVLECPVKISDNLKKDEFKNNYQDSDKLKNIHNIFKNYILICEDNSNMSYLYLQKDDTLRRQNYKILDLGNNFNPDDYKGKILLAVIKLDKQDFYFIIPNN